jgi:hypothetical protein
VTVEDDEDIGAAADGQPSCTRGSPTAKLNDIDPQAPAHRCHPDRRASVILIDALHQPDGYGAK